MKIFDTQTQNTRELTPLEDNKIKMYVCGPTVYDYPHLGHARCYITWDMVYRYLKFRGYKVTYVRNVTDVDDKIINKAKESNASTDDIAKKYYREFEKAMDGLNVEKPDIEPKATENIDEMINIISSLFDKGYAYTAEGDVYFDVEKFQKYGRLSRQNLEELKSGARVEASIKKKNPLDFALWKAVENENEIGWQSPWGKGRPGWHIECTAMSGRFLGESIDIHAGGQDLVFPHHENEKAQSEAAFGKDFVNFWMHNGFVKINEEKMSKSLGNYITIGDLMEKYDANTIRFFILTNHYRMPVEFNDMALGAAKNGVKRLRNAIEDIKADIGVEKLTRADKTIAFLFEETVKTEHIPFHEVDMRKDTQELEKQLSSEVITKMILYLKNFIKVMDEDFNTPRALSVLFDIASDIQKNREAGNPESSAYYAVMLVRLSGVLGFDLIKEEKPSDEMVSKLMNVIISTRQTAREQKNWSISDKIRDELAEIGITLKDHKDKSTTWSFSD